MYRHLFALAAFLVIILPGLASAQDVSGYAFTGIATKGSGNLAAVAPGVAEALVATFAGLAAAIPAVIAYNLYVNRVSVLGDQEEQSTEEDEAEHQDE